MVKVIEITDQEFDDELMGLLGEMRASALLQVQGVYEIVSEHFNNEVIDRVLAKRKSNKRKAATK